METRYSANMGAVGDSSADWEEVGRNWVWIVTLGILLIVAGGFAVVWSVATTVVTMYFLGWVMIAAAILHVVQFFRVKGWNLRLLQALFAVLYLVVGVLVIRQPVAAAASLTLMLAAFLLVAGLFRIVHSLMEDVPMRGWMAFNGIVTTILGFLVMNQWPVSGLWVIGLFIGVDLIMSGGSFVGLGLKARQMSHSRTLTGGMAAQT